MKLLGKNIKLIAYDFDGVMTNNKVLILQMGMRLFLLIEVMGLLYKKLTILM